MTFEEWLGNQIDERTEVYAEIGQECYNNGYEQGRIEAVDDERSSLLAYICKKYNIPLLDMNVTVDEWEEIRGQNNDKSL